jgi:DNA repair exonuclease SbcCD ATPase subunit
MEINSIKLQSIQMKNFMTYTDFTIDNLDKYKIIFVSGQNAQGKSTLTSESIYYGLFGMPLRYKKINDLLSWQYDFDSVEPAFCTIGLSVNLNENETPVILNIKRNIIDENNRFEILIDNDNDDQFKYFLDADKVKTVNNHIKDLLDIDEKKFSILYLKSPFSEVLFESNSDLLADITKSQYINELRKDFNKITHELTIDRKNLVDTIEKQNKLAESIKEQLKSAEDTDKLNENKKQLENIIKEIDELNESLKTLSLNIKELQDRYKKGSSYKEDLVALVSKIEAYAQQLKKEQSKYLKLVKRGKCPTCEQSIDKELYDDELSKIEDKISSYREQYKESASKLKQYNNILNQIDNDLTKKLTSYDSLTGKMKSLSNMKVQLETNIKNQKDTKSNNDSVLREIRNTIMDLNDELGVLDKDYKVLKSISSVMLNKNSEYINKFYNDKIYSFTLIFKSILSKMTKGKFTRVKMKLNNKPILNDNIEYASLSTSERKFIDISFVISYIVYLSTKLKFKAFILDEFLDNYDKKNVLHIYDMIYEIANTYDLQLIITTNMADYLFSYMGDVEDIKIIDLTEVM